MTERREIQIMYTCSDGRQFKFQHEAQKHQDQINIGEFLRVDIDNSAIPISGQTTEWIVNNSNWLFATLSKYYQAIPYEDENAEERSDTAAPAG